MERPLILITNDDGVHATGLRTLRAEVAKFADVVVVAPTFEQSGMSHAITIDRPLRHVDYGEDIHSIDGTPADCVYLAFFEQRFLPRRPDLVLSGINHGGNLGTSVFYSGTVAGAREAAVRGTPAIAFSLVGRADSDYSQAAQMAAGISQRMIAAEKPEGHATLLNVNFPKGDIKGMRVTRVGRQIYEENVVPRVDPGGREYFWIGGRITDVGQVENADVHAVDDGYASVTPLQLEAYKAEHLAIANYVAQVGPSDDVES